MTALLVGFDSAWTAGKRGAIAAVLFGHDGSLRELGIPQLADFSDADKAISQWQAEQAPDATLILLDQPTIVKNAAGQRPVEHIVCSSISARRGGMQPSSTSRSDMFGSAAPIWAFLEKFGGAADPLHTAAAGSKVIETYPVLAMIALGWLREDQRARGRLLKYNPERKKTFKLEDWQYLCEQLANMFRARSMCITTSWLDSVRALDRPKKSDQDKLDACICLLVAVHLAERSRVLMVGNQQTGYMVVPHSAGLFNEIVDRCRATDRQAAEWVRAFRPR